MHRECLPLQLRHARLAVQRLTAREPVPGMRVELGSCVLVMHASLSAGPRMSMPAFCRLLGVPRVPVRPSMSIAVQVLAAHSMRAGSRGPVF